MRAFSSAIVLLVPLFGGACYVCLTGSLVPLAHIEKLTASHPVARLEENGIVLADGKIVMPPGIAAIPVGDETLADTVQHGVEIDPVNGDMFVLVDVDHWCGNDPVRWDLTRVNLSELIAFLSPRSVKAGILTEKAIKRFEFLSAVMRSRSGTETSKPRLDRSDLLMLRDIHDYFRSPGVDPPDRHAPAALRDGGPAPDAHPPPTRSRESNQP